MSQPHLLHRIPDRPYCAHEAFPVSLDDHLRSRPAHRLRDLIGIGCIRYRRHCPHLFEHRPIRLVPCHAVNLVPRLDQKCTNFFPTAPVATATDTLTSNSLTEYCLYP
jgi:hypothetical protein